MQKNLKLLFKLSNKPITSAVNMWLDKAYIWIDEYKKDYPYAQLETILVESSVFLYDYAGDCRVVLAFAISTKQLYSRSYRSLRQYPMTRTTNIDITFYADKGHFLGHASGGRLDINIFPHRKQLNRGWSQEGKLFRKMERHAETNLGTFFYHHPRYIDGIHIPYLLDYGVLKGDDTFWENTFTNIIMA